MQWHQPANRPGSSSGVPSADPRRRGARPLGRFLTNRLFSELPGLLAFLAAPGRSAPPCTIPDFHSSTRKSEWLATYRGWLPGAVSRDT
jgi:hypothetical protein